MSRYLKNFEVRPDIRILPEASTYDRKNSPTRVQWPLMSILLFAAAPPPRASPLDLHVFPLVSRPVYPLVGRHRLHSVERRGEDGVGHP